MYKIYSDGSCKGNGKQNPIGAWSYVVLDENDNIILEDSDVMFETTNNRMEMSAIIFAIDDFLKYLAADGVHKTPQIIVHTDSAYVHNCLTQKWYETWEKNGWINSSRQPVKNKDLWIQLIPFFRNSSITFKKVKGHSTDKSADTIWNNYVDNLATTTSSQYSNLKSERS